MLFRSAPEPEDLRGNRAHVYCNERVGSQQPFRWENPCWNGPGAVQEDGYKPDITKGGKFRLGCVIQSCADPHSPVLRCVHRAHLIASARTLRRTQHGGRGFLCPRSGTFLGQKRNFAALSLPTVPPLLHSPPCGAAALRRPPGLCSKRLFSSWDLPSASLTWIC